MRVSAWGLVVCLLLTGCASAPPQRLSDRYGVVSLELPATFRDQTPAYLAARAQVQGVRRDSGIRMLLEVGSKRPSALCSFRELRYLFGARGYAHTPAVIGASIAAATLAIHKSFTPNDYLRRNIEIPLLSAPTARVEHISSGDIAIGSYTGWQTTRRSFPQNRDGAQLQPVDVQVVVVPIPNPSVVDVTKRYLVAGCLAGGASESERIRGAATIERLLQSLMLTYVPDVPGKDELAISPRASD